jgi:ABC-2 type transport system ATP-binding protein
MTARIDVTAVRKSFGSNPVLRGIDMQVRAGEIVGLLGPNGAGKSTLLRVITGLERPDSGRVTTLSAPETTVRVGALLDAEWLDAGLTCVDHIRIARLSCGRPSDRAVCDRDLDRVGLSHAARRRVKALSLGMRQRLALAVALVDEPNVLVLDEPVNGLDPDGVLWIREMLQSFASQGGAVLLSSHLMSEMERVADRVLVLVNGRLGTATDATGWNANEFVRVRSDGSLGALQSRFHGACVAESDGSLSIRGVDAGSVFTAAVECGVVLTELGTVRVSLEEHYRRLTRP